MQDYTKLKIWEDAYNLSLNIYKITQHYPKQELFGLVSQFRRAGVSIGANIAEGAGKNSNLDFARFISISIGSLNECMHYILLSKDLNYIKDDEYLELKEKANNLKMKIISFQKKLNTSNFKPQTSNFL